MYQIELKIAIVAGLVVSLFFIVAEIVAFSSRVAGLRRRWKGFRLQGRRGKLAFEWTLLALFILIQPFLTAFALVSAVDGFDPFFSTRVVSQLKDQLPQQATEQPPHAP